MSIDFKKVKTFLRQRDIFGHPVSLNFNRKGNFHTTEIGGIFSIIVNSIYFGYMTYLLTNLVTHNDDTYITYDYESDRSLF